MPNVITVQLGQCGNQIGAQFFRTLAEEAATSTDEDATAKLQDVSKDLIILPLPFIPHCHVCFCVSVFLISFIISLLLFKFLLVLYSAPFLRRTDVFPARPALTAGAACGPRRAGRHGAKGTAALTVNYQRWTLTLHTFLAQFCSLVWCQHVVVMYMVMVWSSGHYIWSSYGHHMRI